MQQQLCNSCANTYSCEAYSSYFGPIMECGAYREKTIKKNRTTMISNAAISEMAKSLSKSYRLSPKRTADTAVEYGFKKGINWFFDNLWHPASEEPTTTNKENEFVECLVQFKDGMVNLYSYDTWHHWWVCDYDNKIFLEKISHWLYVDDLLREPVQGARRTDIKIRCSTCKHRQLITTKNYVYGGCDLQSDDYHTNRSQKRYGCSDWEMSDETKQQKRQEYNTK